MKQNNRKKCFYNTMKDCNVNINDNNFFEGELFSLVHYAMLGENREKWDAGETRRPHF